MFTDSRSKKVVLVAHCILNQNSISDGTADFSGTFEEILNIIIESEVGVLQMPCPELLCLGLDRDDLHGAKREVTVENTRIRRALKEESTYKEIELLAEQVIFQLEEYLKNDFIVKGIIGVNRSPSCGVETTSMNNEEVHGMGVFINRLEERLNEKEIAIEMIGVKTSEVDKSVEKVKKLLKYDR